MLIQIKTNTMEDRTKRKQISFKELTRISDLNIERYNRNVYVKKLSEKYGFNNDWKMIVEPIMEHNHFMGEPIESHVRCFIYTTENKPLRYSKTGHVPEIRMVQDMSWDQYNSLFDVDMELSTDTDVLQ